MLTSLRFLSNFAKRTFTVNDQVKLINDFLNVSAILARRRMLLDVRVVHLGADA